MGNSFGRALFLPLILVCAAAQAQKIYMCKDAAGRTFTSDRPIPECADTTMHELDSRGMVRREIAPPPTAEQKRQMQIEEEKRKAEAAAADEQKRQDRAIRMRYRNEGDIEMARKRSLETIREQIKREKASLAAAEKQQRQAQTEMESYKKKNAAVPPVVRHKVEDADRMVGGSTQIIQDAEQEIERINAQFDATVNRFRELVGTTASR
ncbi:DUF4124 domain-containing protein [Noviherbaspirillum sp. UKPF54]|uniref:DUF4124 domain-containing protein n=1 Tax=Noviherbaspirillum sp. UKPF54 TaxID=2601898 RepID=UPI0011B19991|nr:DUF4124 domain-containing protein [Noviherbaspirillum sp. UKPF54]QDZ29210.1 DUF4124 domain-containing protein [Noviherbaspirillum sp. UKPF54]